MNILKRFNHNDTNQFRLDNQRKSLIKRFKSKKLIRFVPVHFFFNYVHFNRLKACFSRVRLLNSAHLGGFTPIISSNLLNGLAKITSVKETV